MTTLPVPPGQGAPAPVTGPETVPGAATGVRARSAGAGQLLLYRAGTAAAPVVPDPVLFPAAALVGQAVARINRRRREVVRRNLERVVGRESLNLERLVDEAFRSYARYWVEALRVPKPGPEEIRRRTTSEGFDAMRRHIDAGRGAIFVSPHLGNWDLGGAWVASHGWRVMAVAEELRPPGLYELFVRLRRAAGVEVHPLGRGGSARALLKGLREGAIVGLIADRDISGSGVEVELFGERTRLPAGPALLALRTGTPLAAGAFYHRPRGRYHAVMLEPIPVQASRAGRGDVRALTQRIAYDFETLIRRAPGQWHMFQPNWPSDPGYPRA